MWSLQVYTRKKRAGQRLNVTPTPDLGPTVKAEAPPGPDRRHSAHCKPQLANLWSRAQGGRAKRRG